MRAEKVSAQFAALTPLTLFAAIEMPTPVPQQKMPSLHSPDATASPAIFAKTA